MGENNKDKRKNKKKKRGGSKRKLTSEQTSALKSINEWVNLCVEKKDDEEKKDEFLPEMMLMNRGACVSDKVVFELHCHSICSDGFLSPTLVVEKAHLNGVKVLALTDHDTMAGIPEALLAARKFGIKIIPGVEISTLFSARDDSEEEPVHILAYYSSCGPSEFSEFDKFLLNIRDGRYIRAKNMLSKLNNLKMPVKLEHVIRIAGDGVAPGRVHVARAMVEAGYVEDIKQAFSRFLYDGGPAYSTGSEPRAEEAVEFIHKTGGVSVLAHPWALKSPIPVVSRLSEAGLHGIEAYRSDGKLEVFSDIADRYGLIKLGGSDYHARGGHTESPLGSVNIPILAINDFLKLARPIWWDSIRNTLEQYISEPSDLNLKDITRFVVATGCNGDSEKGVINCCLSSWLTKEEMLQADFQTTMLKLF